MSLSLSLPPTSQSLPPTMEEAGYHSLLGRGERGVQEVAEGRRVSTLAVMPMERPTTSPPATSSAWRQG